MAQYGVPEVPVLPVRLYEIYNNNSVFFQVPFHEADLWAWGAAIVAYFTSNAIQDPKKMDTYQNFVPGGRESHMHNLSVFLLRQATNLAVASGMMAGVYGYFGVNTNFLNLNTPIKVTPSLQSRDDNPASAQPGICSHQTNPYKALPGCPPPRP